jgi:hypothetical protein
MGDRYGVSQVTDHAYRIVGIDHLQEPTLLQRFSIIEVWSKRLKADARLSSRLRRVGRCDAQNWLDTRLMIIG